MFLFTFISSAIIILFFVAGYFITTIYLFSDEIKKTIFGITLLILSFLSLLFISRNTDIDTIYDGEWKQVYTNNENAKIELEFNSGPLFSINIGTINPENNIENKELLNKFKKSDYYGEIIAKNNDFTEKRRFKLDKSNFIIEENESSDYSSKFKITKVEYRKVKLKQLKFDLIGYKEETKNFSYDGEIRITISPIKKDESLLKLFGEE